MPTHAFRAAGLALLCLLFAGPLQAEESRLSALIEAWLASPHGDYTSRSFTHWNDEGAVPEACAACHSETGMLDWLGADGSAAGIVDHPGTINTVIGCASCHVPEAEALDAVAFPSGVTVSELGGNATCSMCHGGRAHGGDVAAATGALAPDTVSDALGFVNIHFGAAAAVMHGADVGSGFEYAGARYAGRFAHVPSAGTCTACHAPHSTGVETEGCVACHQGAEDITAIRTQHGDFDGDGVTSGGIRDEIAGLHALLGDAIARYAREVAGSPIGYAGRYPYFFTDGNDDGTIDAEEAAYPNRYVRWTPRLLRAAYNYQVVALDGAAWVHNPRYALQLLHDSVVSLSERVELETGGLQRP